MGGREGERERWRREKECFEGVRGQRDRAREREKGKGERFIVPEAS